MTRDALENLRLADGWQVRVIDDHRGVMALVLRDGVQAASTPWCSCYAAAAEELRRGGFVADSPTHTELWP